MAASNLYPAESLKSFAIALLEAAGAPPDNAAIVAEALVHADNPTSEYMHPFAFSRRSAGPHFGKML